MNDQAEVPESGPLEKTIDGLHVFCPICEQPSYHLVVEASAPYGDLHLGMECQWCMARYTLMFSEVDLEVTHVPSIN